MPRCVGPTYANWKFPSPKGANQKSTVGFGNIETIKSP